jgi:predicted acetyltransferase
MIRPKKRGTIKPNASSIVLNVAPVLEIRNVKTPFSYLLKLGISSASVNKMLTGKAVQINFNQLTSLCVALNCTPNDLFALREMNLPEQHQLNKLKVFSEKPAPIFEQSLEWKSIDEVRAILGE